MQSGRVILIIFFPFFYGSSGESVPDTWAHHTVLDRRELYHAYWTSDDNSITFKVEVATKGYVGFGLSLHGGMAGSDIVTGWVKNGISYFQDRHAIGNSMPIIDKSQDWKLIEGSENDTHTTLIFHRKLQTCDKDDIEIDESTMRMIYAYNDKDPKSPEQLEYHGPQNRGVRSVMLLQNKLVKDTSLEGLSKWDIHSTKINMSSKLHTLYWCTILKGLELTEKQHIIKIEPLIKEGNEGYVHHMLMYECVGALPDEYDPHVGSAGHECYVPNMPEAMGKCIGLFAAWGVGGEALIFPEHVGMPLDPVPAKYYMLEVHYDNPAYHEGINDDSGFRMYYTNKLRENDAGTLMIGSMISTLVVIPPGQEEFVITGHSNPECLDPGMNGTGLNVLGVFLHSHLIGRRLKARHFRNKEELPPFADDKNYDFNYQEYHYLSKEVKILPGDQIAVECTYNSKERTNTTLGGFTSREEMCLAFFLYYPRMEVYASQSVPTAALIMGLTGISAQNRFDVDTYLAEYDWKNTNITAVENAMRYSPQISACGKGSRHQMNSLISYPEIKKPYIKPSICPEPKQEEDKNKCEGRGGDASHPLASAFLILAASLWSLMYLKMLH